MKVVAISGWKKSGKDTAANYLIEDHNFARLSFADSLKDMVSEQYGIPRLFCDEQSYKEKPLEQYPVLPKDGYSLHVSKYMVGEFRTLEGQKASEYYIDPSGAFLGVIGRSVAQLYWTPRALCILEGSIKRTVDSGYWVEKVIGTIKDSRNGGDYSSRDGFVISDLRYKSELQQLKNAFGKDLISVRINRFDVNESTDPSENDLNDGQFDIVIENRGSLQDLYGQINKLVVKGE